MLKSILQNYIDEACDDIDIGVVVSSIETGKQVAASYDITASIGIHGGLLIGAAIESQLLRDRGANAVIEICDICDEIGLDTDSYKARRPCDYSPVNPSPFFVLGFGNISLHNGNGVPFSIRTQGNRKDTIKAIVIYLSALRNAEKKDLDYCLEDMHDTDMFITGILAVEALDEIIGMLANVY